MGITSSYDPATHCVATIFNTRNATVQFTDPIDQTITNSQYLSSGVNGDGPDNMDPARRQPYNAGFGAATGALGMRTIQMQVRLQF